MSLIVVDTDVASAIRHQQYLSDAKSPYGYCNYGPTGLICPSASPEFFLSH